MEKIGEALDKRYKIVNLSILCDKCQETQFRGTGAVPVFSHGYVWLWALHW